MADYYVNSANATVWAATTAYSLGQRVVPTRAYATAARKGLVYEVTVAGTSGGTEPTWPTSGTVVSGTVTFTQRDATTWANASAFLDYITQNKATFGDRVFVASTHDETVTTTTDITYGGSFTESSPLYIFSTNDTTNAPPLTLAPGARMRNDGGYIFRSAMDIYGCEFDAGEGTASARIIRFGVSSVHTHLRFESCVLKLATTNNTASSGIYLNAAGADHAGIRWRNCTATFSAAGQIISVTNSGSSAFEWQGGAVAGTAPSTLITFGSSFSFVSVRIEGVDLSPVTGILVNAVNLASLSSVRFARCKLGAGVTIVSNAPSGMGTVLAETCDSADTNYRLAWHTAYGTVTSEIVVVRTGGASDGTTPLAWKLVANSTAKHLFPLVTPWIAVWNETTGTPVTATVEIVRDSATALKDTEVWLEVSALSTSGAPLASLATDAATDARIAAGANQASSAVTWTTTGLASPTKQKLEVTVTPQEKGPILARVVLARATTTVYVDPVITLS